MVEGTHILFHPYRKENHNHEPTDETGRFPALMAGILAVGLVPSAFAPQDRQTPPPLEKIAGYSTGYSDQEGGVAEIVAYNQDNQKFYLVNGR